MLITDTDGNFLFSGKLGTGLSLEVMGKQLFQIFETVKPHIEGVMPASNWLVVRP